METKGYSATSRITASELSTIDNSRFGRQQCIYRPESHLATLELKGRQGELGRFTAGLAARAPVRERKHHMVLQYPIVTSPILTWRTSLCKASLTALISGSDTLLILSKIV